VVFESGVGNLDFVDFHGCCRVLYALNSSLKMPFEFEDFKIRGRF
jgi:hypothetical protein